MNETNEHRLTIAFDAKRAFLNYRGLGNYSRSLLAQLKKFYGENRYLLCTPSDKGLFPWLLEAPLERVSPNGLWSFSPSLWRRYGIPFSLRDKQIDIYHGLSQELPEGIERCGCKTIVTMHDAIFMRYPEQYSATYRHSFIRRNQSACRCADLIIAISEQTKRDYMEFFGVEESRIRVVYQGCNELFWQPINAVQKQIVKERYDLPDNYILSVGALEERKNHLCTIKAMAGGRIELPLIIIGRGNQRYIQQMQQTAQSYGVKLIIHENVRTEDLPAIYRCASVFVYPSLFEGFGIPILEAARSKTPIVTSSGTCFEEIAGEGALYVHPTDSEAIGEAIRLSLQESTMTSKRVKAALLNTEKFRAEQRARDMMDVYQSVL